MYRIDDRVLKWRLVYSHQSAGGRGQAVSKLRNEFSMRTTRAHGGTGGLFFGVWFALEEFEHGASLFAAASGLLCSWGSYVAVSGRSLALRLHPCTCSIVPDLRSLTVTAFTEGLISE